MVTTKNYKLKHRWLCSITLPTRYLSGRPREKPALEFDMMCGRDICWRQLVTARNRRILEDERHVAKLACVDRHRLNKTAQTKVFLNDDVIDGCHDETDLSGIGSTSEMGIDLLRLMLVQANKPV